MDSNREQSPRVTPFRRQESWNAYGPADVEVRCLEELYISRMDVCLDSPSFHD